jgi:hypothetical protein
MNIALIVLLVSVAACTSTAHKPLPCAGAASSPCGPERPANEIWQS